MGLYSLPYLRKVELVEIPVTVGNAKVTNNP
jgi:hypothetical protein